jgi:hypothetical protein
MRHATLAGLRHIAVATALALLAWGALAGIEGHSAPPAGQAAPVASVLGKAVDTNDPEALSDAILTPLLDQYAAERGIRAEPAEIDALLGKMRRDMAASGLATEPDLTPEETAEVDAMQREMARAIIRQWKINKALHEQYGGRIIYQQLGPEPLDAYRQFLRQREADSAFAIRDPALEASFWRYFTDDSMHDFMAPGGADEARAFKIPPWEQQP